MLIKSTAFAHQTTVAFVFATLSSFKALLHDSAAGMLEAGIQATREEFMELIVFDIHFIDILILQMCFFLPFCPRNTRNDHTEEFALRLVDLIGPAAAHVRLPARESQGADGP